ncbi:2-hydroxyacyl-CoA dehydratase [Clostridium tetanomorphum]|uniref:2-hydroxyglutaryl-CoA dehydratase n=1 Tax=Clostridium tetanomorphum TaxID=1553 RepID=A0A923E971_CLOTT|nr:2-hydroxyacyl-CoA dehydratase [Clostridium tetanomorphum]MBC2397036.1 2-hydroxyglutaryl-CoA dehydratase [Clostridium tetanomorphum]NRZ99122.1 putative nucleotide-binding protein (sugar kinase/HSP70/actin superfamily) [Clostridium tetanomorphum]
MVITFPHLGNTAFAAKAIFDGLNIDYILPPVSNKTSLEIGSYYAPEEMCLPFKIMLGSFIKSIENGADTILIPGSCGPCRFGEYSELHMKILKRLGYNINFIVLDYPKDIGIKELLNRINKVSIKSDKNNKEKINALISGYKVINLIDKIEQKARLLTGYEVNKGDFKRALNECKRKALLTKKPDEMISLFRKYNALLDNITLNKSKTPLKVAIIGEIYTLMEPFSNIYIEDKLMDYGISSKRFLYPSWWVKNAVLTPVKLNSLDIKRASKKYLPYYIGGFGKECIGEAVLAKEQRFDGAIQILPMGCMPEIVSKSILPNISKDKDFPIMTLVVDEMTGEGGYQTRIEAFLDLLERRKENVLHGC